MKLNSTTKFLSCIIAMLFSIGVIAQPANDNVCDAIDLTGGGNSDIIDNAGATVEAGEEAIDPPILDGCPPGGWCDPVGANESNIDNSIWFKFDAPAAGSVTISACLSNFDTQVAVYEVSDCSDFSTFTFVWAADDIADCGVLDDGMTTGLSSEMTLECLTSGQTYYILVDGWDNDDPTFSVPNGFIDLSLEEITPTGEAVTIATASSVAPACMGGSNGSATVEITGGSPPYTFEWSTGSTDLTITDLAAGNYTFTAIDACGNTAMETITVADGPAASQIVIASDNALLNPSNCDDGTINGGISGNNGQLGIGVSSGNGPFAYTWSTGETTAYINGLAPGTYTVTVEDACGNIPAVETFTLETETTSSDAMPAGEDVQLCGDDVQIGGGSAPGLGQLSQITYSTNQTLDGNIACRTQGTGAYSDNSYWRAYDLANDFGLSGTVNIEGIDLPLFAESDPASNGLQAISVTLYIASSLDLSTATFTEIASTSAFVPDIPVTEYFRVSIDAAVDASDILAVEFNHPGSGDFVNFFDIRSNATATTQPTYLSSVGCNISTPTLMTDIGFPNQVIMNLIYRTNDASTYTWDDPNGGLSSTTDAMPTASEEGTYTVTVTDVCGNSVVDAVIVDVCTGIVAPEDAVFTISPNPSNGLFQLQNTDLAKNMTLQVFDLQGKMMHAEQFNSTLHTLDLSTYPAGVYVLKLDNGVDIETHKLMVY